jgi:hypothetical protein
VFPICYAIRHIIERGRCIAFILSDRSPIASHPLENLQNVLRNISQESVRLQKQREDMGQEVENAVVRPNATEVDKSAHTAAE